MGSKEIVKGKEARARRGSEGLGITRQWWHHAEFEDAEIGLRRGDEFDIDFEPQTELGETEFTSTSRFAHGGWYLGSGVPGVTRKLRDWGFGRPPTRSANIDLLERCIWN